MTRRAIAPVVELIELSILDFWISHERTCVNALSFQSEIGNPE